MYKDKEKLKQPQGEIPLLIEQLELLAQNVTVTRELAVMPHRDVPPMEIPANAHFHESWEFFTILPDSIDGSFEFVGEKPVKLSTGSMVLVPPRTPHNRQPRTGFTEGRVDVRLIVCTFFPDPIDVRYCDGYRDHRIGMEVERLNHWREFLMCEPVAVLERLRRDLQQASPDTLYLTTLLRHYFAALAATLRLPPVVHESRDQAAVRRALAFITIAHDNPTLSLQHIADQVRMSPSHLVVLFRKHTGKTVRQTLIQVRLKRAYALLREGRFSVKEVAGLTGWSSPLYFSTAFRKHFGYPPSQVPPSDQPPSPAPPPPWV